MLVKFKWINMANFLMQLLKGFFRSVVNQVGRDGGKVISNKVYKRKHSTPYIKTNRKN